MVVMVDQQRGTMPPWMVDLDDDLRRGLGTLADWLALSDPWPGRVDLMLLFGGSTPGTWQVAADAVTAGEVGTLMLVGGRGHTTDATFAALGLDHDAPEYREVSEAGLMARWLHETHGIDEFLLETASTNCGDNVTLAEEVAARHGLSPRTVALVQDPTMQRRMDARFRRTWTLGGAIAVNRPGPDSRSAWPGLRWAELVMGEVPRLTDSPSGYGPLGRDYIAHVDVPRDVQVAFEALARARPEWIRPARRSRTDESA
jgi:hypothetical protein